MKQIATLILVLLVFPHNILARECKLEHKWSRLCHLLEHRVNQTCHKMKLKESEVASLEEFLSRTCCDFEHLEELQKILPKTTIEILMAANNRGVTLKEANLMAQYLKEVVKSCKFKNIDAFDNNTSHIIGRNFYEINYSGEPLTAHRQQQKYNKYGVTDFKTVENLKQFFPVESKLPYFQKIYRPGRCEILK